MLSGLNTLYGNNFPSCSRITSYQYNRCCDREEDRENFGIYICMYVYLTLEMIWLNLEQDMQYQSRIFFYVSTMCTDLLFLNKNIKDIKKYTNNNIKNN